MLQKRWNFGIGTIFSLIVVYFIYLYSKDKGWPVLAFLAKWYIIIFGGLIAISIAVILLVILFSLLMFMLSMVKLRAFYKHQKANKNKRYIDAEYKVKE